MRMSLLLRSALFVALGAYVGCSTGLAPAPVDPAPPPAMPDGTRNADASAASNTGGPPTGAQLVASLGCPHCHTSAAGDFTGSSDPVAGTTAFPANLTPDHDTGIGDWTDADIARAIRTGYDDQHEELCPTMPRFSELSDEDVQSIIAYLRALKPVHHEVPESVCPPVKTGDGEDDAGDGDDAGDDSGGDDAGPPDAGQGSCSDYTPPNTKAACYTKNHIQANGCYGGYFCYTPSLRCVPPPPGCIFPL